MLASDSDTDGYHSEGSYFGGGNAGRTLLDGQGIDNIDGISEHASDEMSSTDSDEATDPIKKELKKKIKKATGEKGGGDKHKRKKDKGDKQDTKKVKKEKHDKSAKREIKEKLSAAVTKI